MPIMIDLRSDTITKPTPQMRQAIAEAEVGDDVFGDDPTIIELEKRTAELLGKDAAVFVPSGTMANQMALRSHTEPGDEILIDANAHIYYYEGGAPAALSGVLPRLLDGKRGIFSGDDVRNMLRPVDQHFATTKLVCIENTHNRGGGSVWTIDDIDDVVNAARDADLKMHLDGARLWNATVATGTSEGEYASRFDSVSVCFSKGLGAPVGSALAGPAEFIYRARRIRKQFGGAMRQAGMIAAGAMYAMENHRERLADDHRNAREFASGISDVDGINIDVDSVETNIVRYDISSPATEVADRLLEAGVWVLATGPNTIRAVFNLMVSNDDVAKAIEVVRSVSVSS